MVEALVISKARVPQDASAVRRPLMEVLVISNGHVQGASARNYKCFFAVVKATEMPRKGHEFPCPFRRHPELLRTVCGDSSLSCNRYPCYPQPYPWTNHRRMPEVRPIPKSCL
jgi:hypothetical protein